jgi:hypothetical protein
MKINLSMRVLEEKIKKDKENATRYNNELKE